QELRYFQRLAKQSIERRASRILEHQRHAAVVAGKRARSRRPGAVQIFLQFVFVSEAIEVVKHWLLRSGKHNEHCIPVAGTIAPSPAEDTIAVPPHHPEVPTPANVEPRG